jgi:hypothetical protein
VSTKRKKPSSRFALDECRVDAEGNPYLTLLVGENSVLPLEVDFYRIPTPYGERFFVMIVDAKSLDAVMVARETLEDILQKGWKSGEPA